MTYRDLYKNKNITMWVDLSTHCNAACPQCHRTNPNGLGKADWLDLRQWSLQQFQQVFPQTVMQNVGSFDFCGTWGDPVMNKDLLEICKYIIDNSKSSININTNGSIRDEEWWWDLGSYCKDRLNVVFAIDGSTQDIHSRYRQLTSLNKILLNMSTVAYTTANCSVFTVLFKHNQDDLTNIARLSKSHGAKRIIYIESNRFENNNKSTFVSNGEQQILEKTTLNRNILDIVCNKYRTLSNDTINELEQVLNVGQH